MIDPVGATTGLMALLLFAALRYFGGRNTHRDP